MSYLLKIWNYLDGKKTTIAVGLYLLGRGIDMFCSQFLTGIWHIPTPLCEAQVIASINWFVTLLGSTGLLHKAVKSANAAILNNN